MPPRGWDVQDTAAPIEVEIGMRWAHLWRLAARPWVPLAFARMVRPGPNPGLQRSWLRVTRSGPAIVQEWADKPTVDDWSRHGPHAAPWKRFAREANGTAEWGIWHRVRAA